MCCPGREDMVASHKWPLARDGAIVLEVWDTDRQGSACCALRAFELGLEVFKGKSFTVLQDDAETCRGFAPYLASFQDEVDAQDLVIQWYAHPWVTSYTIGKPRVAKAATFIERPGGSFICSIATTYSGAWAEKIRQRLADVVEHERAKWQDDEGRIHGDDRFIAETLKHHGGMIQVHVPSLVQHVGMESVVAGHSIKLGSHDARQSQCYVGLTFDARNLMDMVLVPWRKHKKETNMDENALDGEDKGEKKVGEMTVAELYADLKALIEAERDDGGQFLATEYAQELQALTRESKTVSDPEIGTLMRAKGVSVCNECGELTGECGHAVP